MKYSLAGIRLRGFFYREILRKECVAEMDKGIRINKYLSEAGVCSRREADAWIEMGRVRIGNRQAAFGDKVLEGEAVYVDGKAVEPEQEVLVLLVHKPVGIVCTTTEKQGKNNIVTYLNYPKRIYPVGRLDKDSSGLLLMTNQGELVNGIMRAGNYHEKEYEVEIYGKIREDFLKKMSRGVYLEELDRTTRACKVWQTGESSFRIILTQGMNRQIRRMCSALGERVRTLKRIRIMNLILGDLKPGEYRKITKEEMQELLAQLKTE